MITAILSLLSVIGLFGWAYAYHLIIKCDKMGREYDEALYEEEHEKRQG